MARKSAKPEHVAPEEMTRETAEVQKATPKGAKRSVPTKSEAVRRALADGYEGPKEGAAYILEEFGIEIAPQHFSSVKSQFKKHEIDGATTDTPARKSKAGSQAVEGYLAPPPKQRASGGKPDLLEAMEAMKPLVASLGADTVKRIVDLLG
jgi:hypothetical protein